MYSISKAKHIEKQSITVCNMVAAAVVCFRFSPLGLCPSWIAFQWPCEAAQVFVNPASLILPSSSLHRPIESFISCPESSSFLSAQLAWPIQTLQQKPAVWQQTNESAPVSQVAFQIAKYNIIIKKAGTRCFPPLRHPFWPSVLIRSPGPLAVEAPPNGWGPIAEPRCLLSGGTTAVPPMTDPDRTNQFPLGNYESVTNCFITHIWVCVTHYLCHHSDSVGALSFCPPLEIQV